MNLEEIDALLAEGRQRLAPFEVHPEVREEAIQQGEVGMYPGDESVLPKFQKAGKKEFERLRTDRLALTDQVKKARVAEQEMRDRESLWGQTKSTVQNFFAPHDVVQPEPVQAPSKPLQSPLPVTPKPLVTQPKPAIQSPSMSAPMSGKLPSFKDPNEEEAFLTWYGNKAVDEGLPRHPNHDPKTDYRKQFLEAQGLSADEQPDYGLREDGTPKGKGFFGAIPSKNPAFPQGTVSTELSAEADVDGKPLLFPLLVPTLTREEVDALVSGQKPTDAIYDKAMAHALERQKAGKSPFASDGEQVPLPEPSDIIDTPEVHVIGDRLPQPGTQPLVFTDKAGNVTRTVPQPGAVTAPPAPKSIGEGLAQATNSFFQGVAGIPADALKSIAIASRTLDEYVPTAMKDGRKIEERLTYQLGSTIDRLAKRLFPTDPALQKNFVVSVLPQALGSMVGFMAGGIGLSIAKAPVTATALLGAGVGGAEQFEEAKQFKASSEVQQKAFWLGSAVGSSEALPIGALLNRFNKATGGGFVKILKEGGVTAAQEFLQEWGQQIGSNVVAQQLYDEHRSWFDGAGIAGEAGGASGLIVGLLSGILQGRKARKEHQNESATQGESPFFAEPKAKPADPMAGLPEELTLAKRPPFLMKQQPSPAAPGLPPEMVPTTPQPAPVESSAGGRPLAPSMTLPNGEPVTPDELAELEQSELLRDLQTAARSGGSVNPEYTPLPPSSAPSMESPSVVPSQPAMTPEALVPGADLTDRTANEPVESVSQPVEQQEVTADEPLDTPETVVQGERIEPDEADQQETRFNGILNLAADSPPKLRAIDVDRVMSEVADDERESFKEWLLGQDLAPRTFEAVESWTPEPSQPAQKPGTRAKEVSQETAKSKSAELQAYLESLPQDEAKRAYARALIDGLKSGNLPAEPKNLTGAEIQAIQKGLMDAVASGQVKPSPITPDAVVDQAAHEAATSPQNDIPTPTEAMKQAGNYKKGHVSVGGLDISIENPEGSTRSGKDASGKPWSVTMKSHYGYIKGTVGKDKDHLDVFIKPGTPEDFSGTVYVVDQVEPKTGKFDEHKIVLGASTIEEAKQLYRENYAKGWGGLGAISATPMREFKDWLKSGETKKPFRQKSPSYTVKAPTPEQIVKPSAAQPAEFDYTTQGKRPKTRQIIKDWKKAGSPKDFSVTYGETEARFYHGTMGNGRPRWLDEGNGAGGINRTEVIKALQDEEANAKEATPDKVVTQEKPSKPQPAGELQEGAEGPHAPFGGKISEIVSPGIKAQREVSDRIQKMQKALRRIEQHDGKLSEFDRNELRGMLFDTLPSNVPHELSAQAWKLESQIRNLLNDAATPETVVEKPKDPTIAVPSPNYQDLRSSMVSAEKAFNLAETLAEKEKHLRKAAGILKDFNANPGKIRSDDFRTRQKDLGNILSRMNGEMEKFEKSLTPETVASVPVKGATIQAATPEEATNGQPQQSRVEDSRPPEAVSPEDVSIVEGRGTAESVRPRPANQRERSIDDAGTARDVSPRSDGDDSRANLPAERRGRADTRRDDAAVSRSTIATGNDFILGPDYSIPAGQKGKYKANVEAIKLLKFIEAEGRVASPAEQSILAQYTGWGGLPQAFQWSNQWQKEFSELRDLLTEEEYEAARASTPNAHYTDPATIRAIYRGLEHLGFKGGRLLEPGAGVGHFFGAMPPSLSARSQRTAIEKDSLSARLAKQLYQHANVIESEYQKVTLPENFFDVAVGNVPFADVKVFDPHNKDLSKLNLSLHDYYFAKALSQVRPGGIVAFITSRYTMDKVNGKMRDYVASKADLLGAIRLPNTQFKDIANTDVTTDIIVLQRREENTPAGGEAWGKIEKTKAGDQEVAVNEYFIRHPEQIMGTLSTQVSMYRDNEITVQNDGRDMTQALDEAFKRLPEKVLRPRQQPKSTTPRGLLEALEASDDVKDGAYTIQNNALYVRRSNQFVPVEGTTPTDLERAKGLIGLREQVRNVFKSQLADNSDAFIKKVREDLGHLYDRFTKKFGPINGRANKGLFREDPDYGTLQALEKEYDPKTNKAKKADIFTKRIIEYRPKASKVETAKEAMLVSMNETGSIDWDRMSFLTGKSVEAMQQELKGLIFKDPAGEWESADAYLSGNIRAKLKTAEAAAKIDKRYQENVEALKAVIPEDLKPSQIDVKLGHGWIPQEHYRDFIAHLFDVSPGRVTVNYNAHVGAYAVKFPVGAGNTKNDTIYGTQRYKGTALVEDALASKLPTVYDVTSDDKRIVNQKETLAAREKLQKIQDEFKKWLWDDHERARDLARLYNDEFNNVRLRNYDGSHLTLPGINPGIKLRPHQKNAVWRALQSGNTLFAHVVGAGKTYTMIAVAMEARRLRMASKPMIAVPNHLIEQWRDAFLNLYPAAKVLAPTKDDFQAANRKRLVGRIATGDWDAVIIAHSQVGKIPVSVETFEKFVHEQVTILKEYLEELKYDKGGNRNVIKEIEKAKERLETKLEARKAAIAERADAGVSFEETGIDMMMVDEADLFKNLWFPTRMTRVAGLPNTESQRAYDMFLKTQYLNKITNQRGVHFATGTPISNSMAEVFTVQRYLQPQMLETAGLQHFDTWARQFGNTITSMELAPDGSGYRPRTRFAEFVNVPELTQMVRQVMDVKDAEDLKLPVPKMRTGKPINITAKPSEALKAYTMSLIARAKKLKEGSVDPRVDNMLKITGDGRNASLDIRLRLPSAPEDKNSKVVMAVNQIAEEWKNSSDVKGTQIVFLDLSTPKGEGKSKKAKASDEEAAPAGDVELAEETALRGSVYQDIKRKLIRKGIPEKEIAFIHDADTDAKKGKLYADVNAGTVRVLLGSTEKLGAGTNVQERLVAIHNLDAPWRPRDLEQRIGRGVRQGNKLYEADPENFAIAIFNYATEAPSFDPYMWQTLEVKARTITQVMKGDPNVRTIQDVDSAVLSYAEMKAIASGNPMILERVKVETELTKLNLLRSQMRDAKASMRYELATLPGQAANSEKTLAAMQKDREFRDAHPEEPLSIKIDDVTYDDAEAAGKAILKFVTEATATKRNEMTDIVLGTYRGFNLRLKVWLTDDATLQLERTGSAAKHQTTGFTKEVRPEGLVTRLNNALDKMESEAETLERTIKKINSRAEELKAEIDKPFDRDDTIKQLAERLVEIDKALDLTNKDESVMGGEGGPTPTDLPKKDEPDDSEGLLRSERGSVPVGRAPKYTKDAKAYRELRLKEERGFVSVDEEIESRVRAAKQGVKPEGLLTRLKAHREHVWHLVSREYEHLPDTAEFSPLRTDLLRLQKYKGIAADQVQRDLAAIVKPLDKKQYDQFEWKALLSDLKREAEEERALPFGYTPEKVQEDLDRLNEIIERDPKVREAWTKRQQLWATLKKDYQRSMDAIGFDTSKKLTKEDYFRHQVLEYARERHLKGAGSRVRTPTGRGFLRVRQGSSMDINANYVQAEFEVMAQMVYDTQLAKVIKNVDRHYNIRKQLEGEAKVRNNDSLQHIIDEGGLRGAMVEGAMNDFRKRIGMHMGMLRKALELERGDPLSMAQIAEMADDPDSPGNLSSRGILKAISERKAFIKETLGREFLTWQQLVPETHDLWQPREGNVFYMADSIPAQMAKALQEGMLEASGLSADKLRKVLAMGNEREQYVIPKEAKATLDDLSHKEHSWFVEANRHVLAHWKQLMLLAPRRAVRYNVRNITGDADATFVGNPSTFEKYGQASKELIPVMFSDNVLTGEVKEWVQRGGYGTTLQMQELGELNDLKAFAKTMDRASNGGLLTLPAKAFSRYWQAARLSTDYREAIGRYAAYLDYLQQMKASPKGRPENFGASIPETVMALPDIRDRAFKLSNELLGAYDRVSVAGQTIRSFWIPFWSWQEVNATRYYRLMRNALASEDTGSKLRGAAVGTKQAATFLIKATAFWAMLQAWNYMVHGDDEDELRDTNPTVANRPHILFGRDDDGKIRYLAGIGALGDLLAWFGLDAFPGLVGDLMHDRMTVAEALKHAAKAAPTKILGGLTPTVKMPVELLTRENFYPDPFNPRPIQDRGDYLANQTTFGPEIQALRGKPGKSLYGSEDVTGLLVQRTDPKSAAYGTWMGIEKKYLERMGKDSPAIFWRSPRGQALSNWSRAIADQDSKAETHWRAEYERLEREKHGMKFSQTKMWKDIEQSLRAKAPLAGMTIAERDNIVKGLDAQEKRTLQRAEAYYRETLLQVLPESRRRTFAHKLESRGWLTRQPAGLTPEMVTP